MYIYFAAKEIKVTKSVSAEFKQILYRMLDASLGRFSLLFIVNLTIPNMFSSSFSRKAPVMSDIKHTKDSRTETNTRIVAECCIVSAPFCRSEVHEQLVGNVQNPQPSILGDSNTILLVL